MLFKTYTVQSIPNIKKERVTRDFIYLPLGIFHPEIVNIIKSQDENANYVYFKMDIANATIVTSIYNAKMIFIDLPKELIHSSIRNDFKER